MKRRCPVQFAGEEVLFPALHVNNFSLLIAQSKNFLRNSALTGQGYHQVDAPHPRSAIGCTFSLDSAPSRTTSTAARRGSWWLPGRPRQNILCLPFASSQSGGRSEGGCSPLASRQALRMPRQQQRLARLRGRSPAQTASRSVACVSCGAIGHMHWRPIGAW